MPQHSFQQNKIPVNPKVLAWARNRAGYDIERVAQKLNVNSERIEEWESGCSSPTPKQGRKLAEFYGRPFLEFFFLDIPHVAEPQLVPDFRFYKDRPKQGDSRNLRDILSWAEEKRLNALDLLEELDEAPPPFPPELKFTVNDDPDTTADTARHFLQYTAGQFMSKPSDENKTTKLIRSKLEQSGILVLKQNEITKLGIRGICLCIKPLPVIVFGKEPPSAQSFTLLHEFAHILIGKSAISGKPFLIARNEQGQSKKIEQWCNNFAASFLIPRSILEEKVACPDYPAKDFDRDRLSSLAKAFAVSTHAMLIQLVNLGYVESNFYWSTMWPEFKKLEASYKIIARPKYYGQRFVNSHGDFYTGLVLEALGHGLITNHNAAEFLGIKKLSHLKNISETFRV